jgi:hypothetical protein
MGVGPYHLIDIKKRSYFASNMALKGHFGDLKHTLKRKGQEYFEILFSLKGSFWGQKASFKTIIGPILGFFYCYYGWLP